MNGLQRLPAIEQSAILELVRECGLPVSQLRCEYTMQHGEGTRWSRRFGECNISYDLHLCKFCGNLPETANNTPYCPHKMGALKARLLPE